MPVIRTMNFSKKANWLLIGAVVLTLANGLVISLFIFPALSGPMHLEGGDGWDQVAENIVRGNGFVYDAGEASTFMTGSLKREPLYSLFLAAVLNTFGSLNPYTMLLQCLINSLTCLVLYFVARKTFGHRIALLACFFYAFYPFASWYVPRIAYETLLGFLITLLALSLVNLFEDLSVYRASIVGLLMGITVLCRGIYLLLPCALLLGLLTRFGVKNRRVIRCWLISVVVMLVVMSPWVMRNYFASREFVPITTQGGISFFIGNKIIDYYSLSENTAGEKPEREHDLIYKAIRNAISRKDPHLSDAAVEAQTDKQLIRMAVQYIITHPLKFIEKMLKGAVLVWFVGDTGLKSTGLLLMQGPLVSLCVLGIFYGLKDKRPVLPLLTILLYFISIQTAFSSYGRYSYPMVPLLIAFAAYAVEMFRSRYRRSAVDGPVNDITAVHPVCLDFTSKISRNR